MKKTIYVLACFISVTASIQAQLSKPLLFTHYTTKEGLASNNIFQVTQDKTGFIWLGTDNGLQRYDGNRFVVFRHSANDTTSLPDNVIHKLFMDKKDRLWVASGKKAGIFDKATFRFKQIDMGKVNSYSLKKIIEDEAGRIVFFFGGGKLYVYNETNNQLDSITHLPPLPAGWNRDDIVLDQATKRYWMAGKQGLLLYDPQTRQYSYRGHNVLKDSTIERMGNIANTRHFFIDQKGRRWVVSWVPFKTSPELYCYDTASNKLFDFKQDIGDFVKGYFEIWGMLQQRTGSLWVHGLKVLGQFNDTAGRFQFIPNEAFRETGIHYDHILSIFEDRENNTWIGTNMGLYRCNPAVQQFVNLDSRRPNDTTVYNTAAVNFMLQTKNLGLWTSVWGHGIFSYDQNMRPIPNPVTDADAKNKNLYAYCMLQPNDNEIWIGLKHAELKVYDIAARKVHSMTLSVIGDNGIRQLATDRNKNVWMISENGLLLKCAGGNWRDSTRSIQVIQRLPATSLQLYIDWKDNVWVGTDWQGLFKIDGQTGKILENYTEQTKGGDGLMQQGANDIIQYNDSLFLIAANGVNILNANTNRFTYLTQTDGLPADGTVCFIKDGHNIWIGMGNGFCRLNFEKKMFVTYGVRDGITTSNLESASWTRLSDGRIAMGTLHDFLVFDPAKVIAQRTPPPVVITGFTLVSTPLPTDSLLALPEVVLPYDKNAVNIEFSTLTYTADYKISYMLEGQDEDWKTADRIPEAVYTYLPPGDYTFKVKAENGDGVSSKITTFQITVTPPFWNTWWFYGILVLAGVAVLYGIDRVRVEKREAMYAIRTQIAGDLHHEINTTLDNISLLSELAKLKAGTDVDRSKEYIDQIHDKSRRMKTSMDNMLWSIDPANDSMEKSLLRLTEFTQALKSQYGIHVEISVDEKVKSLHLDMKRRHEFFILYTEALSAVIAYAHSKAILVNIENVKNKLSLKISGSTLAADRNQEGIDSCMHEVSKRAESINADLDLQYNDESMFVEVLVPVK